MKYIIIGFLIISSIGYFAFDKSQINGAKKYGVAVKNLEKIEDDMKSIRRSLGYWQEILEHDMSNRHMSDEVIKLDQNRANERNKKLQGLTEQYNEAKKIVRKYEPYKKKHDEQIEAESEDSLGVLIFGAISKLMWILFIGGFLWFFGWMANRNKRLLEEGKITQEEYERLMQSNKSSIFADDARTNPATGLRIHGSLDSSGNPAGSSSSSSMSSSASQDYRDRNRWN